MNLARLPSLLAIPLQGFEAETASPVMRLHRLCDAVELLTRFCTVLALGEWRDRHGDALPQELTGLIRERQLSVERPTFGQWVGLLSLLIDPPDRAAPLVVRELPEFVTRHLLPLLPGGERTGWDSLLALRNDLAHGGGMTRQAARDFLACWEPRLRDLAQRLAFLDDAVVCLFSGGVARRLTGPSPQLGEEWPLSADLRQTLLARPLDGHVLLLRQERWLDLWPLCAFGRAGTVTPDHGKVSAAADSPLVYFRAPTQRLRYVALGSEWPFSDAAGQAVEEFRRLFQLDVRVAASSADAADFDHELQRDADALVGREAELKHLIGLIKAAQEGVFWLCGPGGIGKSYLAAALACSPKLRGDPKKLCLIAWRFKVSDQNRGTRAAFFRHAVTRLAAWLQRPERKPDPDAAGLWKQLTTLLDEVAKLTPASPHPQANPPRLLFVLDGLDEIARLDANFATVPLLLSRPNVVWLCAGRPEGRLPEVFTPQRCTHVFPPAAENPGGGLPDMNPADVRAMLLDGSGALKYQLLPLDEEPPGELGASASRVRNEAVEAVVQRAAGLPLFVHFVAEDVLSGHFRFRDLPQRLPPSLSAYYEDLLDRLAISDLRALLTPLVTTIAWARTPLDEDLLHLLMARRKALTASERGRRRLREGLEAVQGLVRLAPIPGGQLLGFEMYHPTFRDHIRRNESGKLDEQTELTLQEFCELAVHWAEVPAERPSARDYALRYGVLHLLEAGKRDEAVKLLLDLPFLEAKAEAGLVFELAGDFTRALDRLPAEREDRRLIGLLGEALRADVHFLSRHPTALFQCLWNRCYWHDAPETQSHYAVADSAWPAGTPPWKGRRPRASDLVARWSAERQNGGTQRGWFRSKRPLPGPLGGTAPAVFSGHRGPVTAAVFSPDGGQLASAGFDGTIRVWNLADGREMGCLAAPASPVNCVAYSAAGDLLIAGSTDGLVRVWNPRDQVCRVLPPPRSAPVICVACSPDGTTIASGAADGTLMLSDLTTGRVAARLTGPWSSVGSVSWSTDGKRLAFAADQTVRVIDVPSGAERLRLEGHTDRVRSVCFGPDGGLIASGGDDRMVRAWSAHTGEALLSVTGHERGLECVVFSRDGRRVISGARDGTVREWSVATGEESGCLRGHEDQVRSVAVSPDDRWIVSASFDGRVLLWERNHRSRSMLLANHTGWITTLAFTPDGSCLASGAADRRVGLWDVARGVLKGFLESHTAGVSTLAFSADGTLLLSAGDDGSVCVWHASTRQLLARFHDHQGRVEAAAFSNDGRMIASCGWDGTVRVTGWLQNQLVAAFSAECVRMVRVQFSADDRFIRAVPANGGGRWWALPGNESLAWPTRFDDIRDPPEPVESGPDTRFPAGSCHEDVVWFSGRLSPAASSPGGAAWACASGNHLHLLAIEGVAAERETVLARSLPSMSPQPGPKRDGLTVGLHGVAPKAGPTPSRAGPCALAELEALFSPGSIIPADDGAGPSAICSLPREENRRVVRDMAEAFARYARTGHSPGVFFHLAGEEFARLHPLIAQGCLRVFEEQNLGTPLEEALLGLARRHDVDELTGLVRVFVMQRRVGGDIAEELAAYARILADEANIEKGRN